VEQAEQRAKAEEAPVELDDERVERECARVGDDAVEVVRLQHPVAAQVGRIGRVDLLIVRREDVELIAGKGADEVAGVGRDPAAAAPGAHPADAQGGRQPGAGVDGTQGRAGALGNLTPGVAGKHTLARAARLLADGRARQAPDFLEQGGQMGGVRLGPTSESGSPMWVWANCGE